jgi:hypothetical protein
VVRCSTGPDHILASVHIVVDFGGKPEVRRQS